eukprot:768290-Hanusia_phi.AAC.2
MLHETSKVDIVDISASTRKAAARKLKTSPPGQRVQEKKSWFKRMAGPLLARCGNKEAVLDEDTYDLSDEEADSDDVGDFDPESSTMDVSRQRRQDEKFSGGEGSRTSSTASTGYSRQSSGSANPTPEREGKDLSLAPVPGLTRPSGRSGFRGGRGGGRKV